MKGHRITVSDEVYEHLKSMIEDEHVWNTDMSEEHNENGGTIAHRPTFSEVIGRLIEEDGGIP
jgi:predicted CopG family antitoxin